MIWRSIGSAVTRYRHELILVAVVAASFVVVWPVGEYAVLDDWAFVKSLEYLHFQGKLVVLDWNPMSLTGHLIWGLLFTKVLGFSFLSVKIAECCAGLLLTLIVYWFARQHGANPRFALIAGLALFLNPLFLFHSFAYMTDVTGLLWQWLSIYFLFTGLLRSGRSRTVNLTASSIFWALAILTRQHGVSVPIALGAYILFFDRSLFNRTTIFPAFVPGSFISLNGLLWHGYSQGVNQSLQASGELVWHFLANPPWRDLPYIFWTYAIYVGLFVAPVVLAVHWNEGLRMLRSSQIVIPCCIGFGFFIWTHASMNGVYFPYCRNVITPFGLFQPNEFAITNPPQFWDREWGMAVGFLGLVSVLLWIAILNQSVGLSASQDSQTDWSRAGRRFLWMLLGIQLAYVVATSPILYDRHLLLLAPTVIVLVAISVRTESPPQWLACGLVLAGYAYYGTTCSHDVHSISRAVFAEGDRLLASGVAADHIDAGYAFDGWYMYEKSHAISRPPAVRLPPWWPKEAPDDSPPLHQPWWVYCLVTQIEPEYVVTASSQIPSHLFRSRYHFDEEKCQQRYWTFRPWGYQNVRLFHGTKIKTAGGHE